MAFSKKELFNTIGDGIAKYGTSDFFQPSKFSVRNVQYYKTSKVHGSAVDKTPELPTTMSSLKDKHRTAMTRAEALAETGQVKPGTSYLRVT